MKITVNIDCTPEEARTFLGLPDVKPMQDEMMQEIREQITSSIRSLTPDEMLRTWLPSGMAGLEKLQELLATMGSGKRG